MAASSATTFPLRCQCTLHCRCVWGGEGKRKRKTLWKGRKTSVCFVLGGARTDEHTKRCDDDDGIENEGDENDTLNYENVGYSLSDLKFIVVMSGFRLRHWAAQNLNSASLLQLFLKYVCIQLDGCWYWCESFRLFYARFCTVKRSVECWVRN